MGNWSKMAARMSGSTSVARGILSLFRHPCLNRKANAFQQYRNVTYFADNSPVEGKLTLYHAELIDQAPRYRTDVEMAMQFY